MKRYRNEDLLLNHYLEAKAIQEWNGSSVIILTFWTLNEGIWVLDQAMCWLLRNNINTSPGFLVCVHTGHSWLKTAHPRLSLVIIGCLLIKGSPGITGSWIPRAPMKGFWWHLHVGSSVNRFPKDKKIKPMTDNEPDSVWRKASGSV